MILLLGLLAGLLVGWASGGSVRNLSTRRLRGETVLLAILVVQLAAPLVSERLATGATLLYVVWLGSFAGVVAIALWNLAQPGLPAVAAGAMLNLSVILANGGMPVSAASMTRAGHMGPPNETSFAETTFHQLARPDTTLPFIADVLPMAGPTWLRGVVSAGDVLVMVGVVVFIVAGMQPTPPSEGAAAPQKGPRRSSGAS